VAYSRTFDILSPWYPPAEAALPVSTIIRSALWGGDDFTLGIRKYLNTRVCVLGISGRALLSQLLIALKGKVDSKRKQVLIPGYTCYSVAASVVRAGLSIACYDLNSQTFEPDMESVHAMAGPETLAIIGQHLFGIPAPMEGLMSAARRIGAYLIEDAAQGLGGTLRGKPLGTLGDFGFFSFGRGKPLPLGTGGALVGDPEMLRSLVLEQGDFGYLSLLITALTRMLSNKRVYGILEALPLGLGKTIFDPEFPIEGMPRVVQRLGASFLNDIETLNSHRYAVAQTYHEVIGNSITPGDHPGARAVYTRYPVMAGRDALPKTLFRLGVRRMYPKAIMDEPAIKPYCVPGNVSTSGASMMAERLITLPTHSAISHEVARDIALKVREAYQ
jgi:dTDP-4-amino-4,6-dideoxygalactose transaminase